jgi:hypothetical protein
MMNKENFRLGNYVALFGVEILVKNTDFVQATFELGAVPIQLDEEWMWNLGFEKKKHFKKLQNGMSKYDWFRDSQQLFSIEKHHSGEFNEGEVFYPTFRFNNSFIPLQYVHQLQNLYFALTGEDLTLNK